MKIALKNQAIQKTFGSVCSVEEYQLNDDMLDIAVATISGCYPDKGSAELRNMAKQLTDLKKMLTQFVDFV